MRNANEKQRKTLAFLQKKEAKDETFTAEELSNSSTYPLKESLLAKLSRNEFGEFIVRIKDNLFRAQHTLGINANQYAYMTSSRYRHKNPSSHSTSSIEKKESERIVKSQPYNKPS